MTRVAMVVWICWVRPGPRCVEADLLLCRLEASDKTLVERIDRRGSRRRR